MASCKRPWPVLLLCCVLVCASCGMAFGLGAIFADVMDTFGVSRARASLVQSVCTGFVVGGGIFSGHVLQAQGPRATVIAGSVLATVGCVIAFLATHIAQVIVGIGVIAGSGMSLIFLTSLTLPGVVFHEVKSLALGIIVCASATGSAVYPLLLRHVTNHYSVRGTFLIMAAISCQMILCGVLIGLYIPGESLEASTAAGKTAGYKKETEIVDDEEEDVCPVVAGKEDFHEEDEGNPLMPVGLNKTTELNQDNVNAAGARDESVIENDESPNDYFTDESPGPLRKSRTLPFPDQIYQGNTNGLELSGRRENEFNPDESVLVDEKHNATTKKTELPMSMVKMDIHPSPPNVDNDAGKTPPRSCCSLHAVRKALSVSLELCRDVRFFMLSVVGGSALLFYPLPWMFMTDMVKANNLSVEDGSLFITILFAGSLTGRVSSGFLYKLLKSKIQIMYSVAVATGGILCLLFVFCKSYAHFVVVSFALGLSYGLATSTLLMSTLELVGPRKFALGVGYLTFCQGFCLLLAGPYGGMIRDLTNSYELLYYIALVHGLVVAALLFFTTLKCQPSTMKRTTGTKERTRTDGR